MLDVTSGHDHFVIGEGAIGGRALRESGRNREGIVLKRWMGLIDAGVDDGNPYAQAGLLHSAHGVPRSRTVHQLNGTVEQPAKPAQGANGRNPGQGSKL